MTRKKKVATSASDDTQEKLVCGVPPGKYRVLMMAVKEGKCTREELEEAGILKPTIRSLGNRYLAEVLEKLGKTT